LQLQDSGCIGHTYQCTSVRLKDKFEDTKGIIGSLKSKNIQCNDHKKGVKSTNNDLQSITQKTKDQVTRTPLKTWGEEMFDDTNQKP